MPKYRSELAGVIHESASSMFKLGPIDAKRLREYDGCLLEKPSFSPAQIKRLRVKNKASQSAFATLLGVSTGMAGKWERGEKKPGASALRLLMLAEKSGLSAIA